MERGLELGPQCCSAELLGCFQRGKGWVSSMGGAGCGGVTVPVLLPYPELFCRKQLQPCRLLISEGSHSTQKKPQMKLKELLFHKGLIKRLQFLIGSFRCVQAHSSVWPLRAAASSALCQQSSREPGEAEAPQRVPPSQGDCGQGLSLRGYPAASSTRQGKDRHAQLRLDL